MKLSFIVPVYKVAPYLCKCVDSLLAQDYEDYEIILVDDGSPDECPQICDSYVDIFDHIRVVHRENGGLSAARNSGIAAAKGEYLCFVDSDDYWEKNVLGGLMEQIEREQLNVLRYDYQNVRVVDGEYEVFEPNKSPRKVDRDLEVVDGERYLNTRMGYGCYAWQFIIKRSLIVESRESIVDRQDCLFKEGIYFEDTEWTPRMLVRAKRVGSTQTVVYNYFWRDGSITKAYTKEQVRKKVDSLYQVNLSLQQLLPLVSDSRWLNGCMADNVYAMLNNVAAYAYEAVPSWIDRLKKDKMLPLHGYKIRKMTMLRYGMINMCPRIYCWMRKMRKKHQ